MPTRLRLYDAENIGCATSLVLVIPPCFPSRFGRGTGAHIGMQRDRLLIQADHRFGGIVRLFVRLQHVFHFGDVFVIEFGDAPHFFPATA